MPLPNYSTALDKSIRSICEIRVFSFIDVFLDDLDMSFYLIIFASPLNAHISAASVFRLWKRLQSVSAGTWPIGQCLHFSLSLLSFNYYYLQR